MERFVKLPRYFSVVALFISLPMGISKGVSLPTTLLRTAIAAACFYLIGFGTMVMLAKTADNAVGDKVNPSPDQENDGQDERFEELEFKKTEITEQDE